MIFHGNLSYAYLTPDRYEFVIRNSYEVIFDTMAREFPDYKYVFEASGYTVEQIAKYTPDVLEKLGDAISRGRCEFMGSPHAHPMLPNFPEEDGVWSLKFANETYARLLGVTPKSFWNPECGWRSFVPRQVLAAGYKNMIGDFEAYSRSLGADGRPLRPEIYAEEKQDDKSFYSFGFKHRLAGEERTIHFPFRRIAGVPEDSLRMFLRTDRVAQFGVRFFMGMEGYTLEKYLDLIGGFSKQAPGEPEGALIIFADDAEYVGTNGWFRLKYQNKPDNVFERTPDSREKLIRLVSACGKTGGGFITFDEACRTLRPLEEEIRFDDDSAWHGARASTWAGTPMARLLRPWQDLIREKLTSPECELDEQSRRMAWYHLTNSYNSDGQWPPTLPDAPHIVHPFNYAYCYENLLRAELMVGGVDRKRLAGNPAGTIREILGPQQKLILKKIRKLGCTPETQRAAALVRASREMASLRRSKVLHPSEYTARADAMVEARRLVGGIDIEKVAMSADEFTGKK